MSGVYIRDKFVVLVGRFDIALFSALEQTRCVLDACDSG